MQEKCLRVMRYVAISFGVFAASVPVMRLLFPQMDGFLICFLGLLGALSSTIAMAINDVEAMLKKHDPK